MYTREDYPPFPGWFLLTRYPCQHPTMLDCVVWKDRRGVRGGYLNKPFTPPPQKQPQSE
jgi:hypothetical protein